MQLYLQIIADHVLILLVCRRACPRIIATIFRVILISAQYSLRLLDYFVCLNYHFQFLLLKGLSLLLKALLIQVCIIKLSTVT